jgi:hypothetical protein
LESEINKKNFARLNKILKGSDGIVYLMFVGRETYAGKVQSMLVGKIYKHSANVNQAVDRLLKYPSEFLVFKNREREEGTRGREAEIYSANLEPIFLTLKSFEIDFNQTQLRFTLVRLAENSDQFPTYLTNIFEASVVRTFSWNSLLSLYFAYLLESLKVHNSAVFPIPEIKMKKETIDELLKENPGLKEMLFSISMQLSSPNLKLNPKFKDQLAKSMKGLENLELFAQNFVEFLVELQKMGIKDASQFSSMCKETIDKIEQVKALSVKLEEVTAKIEQISEKNKLIK